MRRVVVIAVMLFACEVCRAADRQQLIVVVGAEGTAEYGQQFRAWAERWKSAGEQGHAEVQVIGAADGGSSDRDSLHVALKDAARGTSPLWLVLIGHGTFDGKTAKFNLRGADISAAELAEWLRDIERPLVIANCFSCSGGFLGELSGKNRVVLTATRSGHEYNFARFGDYLSAAIADPRCDLDKDNQTSLLEAYLFAAARVREFYATEARLATEHALLEDNGDQLGTPADWFKGLQPTKAAKGDVALDGGLARSLVFVASADEQRLPEEIRVRRDELEQRLADLRGRKGRLDEAAYFEELEALLVELARLGERVAGGAERVESSE
jgi:hypothetical protein